MRKQGNLVAGLLTTASVMAIASAASAQAPKAGAQQVEEVVVTGSRVIQNGNNMPTPVTVVSSEQLLQTNPSNVQEGLLALPVLSSAGGQTGPQRQPGNSGGNSGAHRLDLRSLGTTRTLVLFDGRRLPPTTPTGEVVVDIVPSMLLQRVDVVTGGASAVYGSDAVAGVVNFITDRNFNGWKFEAMAGRSQLGDADEQRIGFAAGASIFGGRGHIEGSYEYYNSPGVFSKLNREWARHVWSTQGAGTTASPNHLVDNTRLSSTSFYGVIKNGPLADRVFRQNGVLSPFIHGAASGVAGVESGGDGAYYDWASLLTKSQWDQGFGRFDFDVTDNVHFYVEAVAMASHNMNNHQNNETNRNTTISSTNAFLAPEYQATLAAAKVATFTFAKMWQDLPGYLPGLQPESYTTDVLVNAGFTGDIKGWKWDLSYLWSKNEQSTRNNHNLDNRKLAAALDAVRAPNGDIVCQVTLNLPTDPVLRALYQGCVPLNVFGPNSESEAAKAYVQTVTKYTANTDTIDLGASIAGSPFSTWAGAVQTAVSAEYRKVDYQNVSNAEPIIANCASLRFNCNTTTLLYINDVLASRSPVSQSVKELAVEADVPLLKDVAFAESLNANGAYRFTDYDTSGSVSTWKLGADWHVNEQISFRATRSRDIRAPNLNETRGPQRVVPAGCTDLHTTPSTIGQCPFITDSNPNLVPEIAQTTTAGVILRPNFLPNFSLSIDYYKININNAITTIQGQNATIQAICEASNGTSEFCLLQQRPLPFSNHTAANFVLAFFAKPQNAQKTETHGVDIEGNYNVDVFTGRLNLRALVSYQPELLTVQFPGAPTLNDADTAGLAKYRATVFAKYTLGDWSLDVQERWHSGTFLSNDRSRVTTTPNTPSAAYTNATITYKRGEASYYLAIRNLFDKQPTPFSNGGSVPGLFGGYVPGDDNIGRYFNVGVRLRH